MIDAATAGIDALGRQSPYAPALLFAAGVLTSVGPCSAPRMLAITSFAAGKPRARIARTLCFVGGILCAYGAFAACGALLTVVFAYSSWLYLVVAGALTIAGVVTLLRDSSCCSATRAQPAASSGGAMLVGLATGLVMSPCCTPILAAVVTYGGVAGSAAFCTVCVVAFGIGHTLPLLAIGIAGRVFDVCNLQLAKMQGATSIIGGSLMLALGAYYLVLV